MPPHHPLVASRRPSLDTASIWGLLATFVVAVFVFIPSDSVPFVATKTFVLAAGALVTFALYILARLARGNVILPPTFLVGALWLPPVAYTLSALFSGTPFTEALWGSALESDTLGFMLVAAGLGTLCALVVRRPEHYRLLLSSLARVFGVVVILQALVIVVGQLSPSTVSPAFSILGSFGDLSFLLGLGVVAILITVRFLELSSRNYRALVGTGVVALFLLAVTNSGLVWTLVGLAALGLFVEAVMRRDARMSDSDLEEAKIVDEAPLAGDTKAHSPVLPLAVLAVSVFFLIGGTLGGALASALNVSVLNVRPSWQSTLSIASQVYADAPMFGTGPGTFGVQWLKHRDASLNSTVFWDLDFSSGIGFIPTSLATTGLAGALAWGALLLLLIVLGLRTLILRAPQEAFTRYVAILSFVAAVYLLATAIFDVPNTIILSLAFVFAGLFASTTRFAAGSRQWGVVFSRSPRLGFVIVFSFTILLLASVIAAYALVEHYLATTSLARARTAFSAGNLDVADRAVQDSILFVPSPSAYLLQAGVMNGRLSQIVSSSTLSLADAQQAFQAALSSGINAALTATRLAPSDYKHWMALGNLYAQAVPLGVSGAYESARDAYEKARELNPTNPQIPYILAQLDIAHKDPKAAVEHLKTAITLKQDYIAAIFLLSRIEVSTGNVEGALNSALAAAYFAPNDPNILFQVGILRAATGDLPGAAQALSAAVSVNTQFANARYFLAAVYAKQGNLEGALSQLEAVAAMSADNANAVASQIAALQTGKNPFPENLFSVPSTPVE